jgi:hypothetical protein
MRRRILVVVSALAVSLPLSATEPNTATRRWWAHVQALASDAMQGREGGSEGHRRAAEYVASQFRLVSLAAAGEADYFQPVPMRAVRFTAARSSAALIRANGGSGRSDGSARSVTFPAKGYPRISTRRSASPAGSGPRQRMSRGSFLSR